MFFAVYPWDLTNPYTQIIIKRKYTVHRNTLMCPHSATYFGLHDPSSGTYFDNILINVGAFQLAILSC